MKKQYLWTNCPLGELSAGELSVGRIVRGQIVRGRIVVGESSGHVVYHIILLIMNQTDFRLAYNQK